MVHCNREMHGAKYIYTKKSKQKEQNKLNGSTKIAVANEISTQWCYGRASKIIGSTFHSPAPHEPVHKVLHPAIRFSGGAMAPESCRAGSQFCCTLYSVSAEYMVQSTGAKQQCSRLHSTHAQAPLQTHLPASAVFKQARVNLCLKS